MNDREKDFNRTRTYSRKRKKWRKYIAVSLLFIALVGIATTGYTYWKVNQFLDEVSEESSQNGESPVAKEPSAVENGKQESKKENKEPNVVSVLIVGVDYRPVLGSMNTDVMMLASINADTKKVSLVSIPRDTHISMERYGDIQMNAIYAQGEYEKKKAEKSGNAPTVTGPVLLKQAVGQLFNVPVDYYVRVDFDAFKNIIDELGGIKVNVDRNMRWVDEADGTNINLKQGEQILSGKEALDFVRFRRSLDGPDSSDYDRNARQQMVVKASAEKLKSFFGIINFFDVLETAGNHIRTDMDKEALKNLALSFRNGPKEVESLPTNAYWEDGRTKIDKVDRERINKILSEERTGVSTREDEK